MTIQEELAFDRDHIWHPYTSTTNPLTCYHVESAEGCRINLSTGERLIDGMSSWWCTIFGYNHDRLNQAALGQLGNMSHVMFGGLTHSPAINLCQKLLSMTPFDKVFLADSGSVAVEVSLKMDLQYWKSLNKPEKKTFLSVSRSYHGDTFGAMSVCDPVGSMHSLYKGYLYENIFAPPLECGFHDEWDDKYMNHITSLVQENHHRLAAVIMEPIVQGAGGMVFHNKMYLVRVKQLCEKYNMLLIFDEIATGFGRTGKMFAYQHADLVPDIMCLGKALTGGYMTLSAVLTTSHVGDTISNAVPGCLMHGPTFMGNPLAASVACEVLQMLGELDVENVVNTLELQLEAGLSSLRDLPKVQDVRILGGIGVVELKEKCYDMESIQREFVQKGVWVRPFGKLIYVMPSYVMSEADLAALTSAICQVVRAL